MRHFHLPDETCLKGHKEVSARVFGKHKRVCDGSGTSATGPPPLQYSQLFTEVEGSFPQVVACKLCDVKLVSKALASITGISTDLTRARVMKQQDPLGTTLQDLQRRSWRQGRDWDWKQLTITRRA